MLFWCWCPISVGVHIIWFRQYICAFLYRGKKLQTFPPTPLNRQIIKSLSTSQDNPRSPLPRNPSLCRARKKNLGYCECCHEPFKDQDEVRPVSESVFFFFSVLSMFLSVSFCLSVNVSVFVFVNGLSVSLCFVCVFCLFFSMSIFCLSFTLLTTLTLVWQHLQSAQHRGFVQDPSHYSLVDQLVADMEPGFAPCPAPESASSTLLRWEPGLSTNMALSYVHWRHSYATLVPQQTGLVSHWTNMLWDSYSKSNIRKHLP